jgi:hypothetical protein
MQPRTPGEDLIDHLNTLRKTLNTLRERLEDSGVERTAGLRDAMGNDCRFFKKSVNIFLEKDYVDLKTLIQNTSNLFNIIEGHSDR